MKKLMDELVLAAQELLDQIEVVQNNPDYIGIFNHAAKDNVYYDGPGFGKQQLKLKEILTTIKELEKAAPLEEVEQELDTEIYEDQVKKITLL